MVLHGSICIDPPPMIERSEGGGSAMPALGFRSAAFSISLVGHIAAFSTLLNLQPLDRTRPTPVVGLIVPGDGYSADRTTLVFIEEEGTAVVVDRPAPPSLEAHGEMRWLISPSLPEFPDISELEDAPGTANAAEPAPVDGIDSAALLQRYVGQIRARIDRAWDLPANQSAAYCSVHITQSPDGEVLDLQMGECELDGAARETLIAAVRRASPLPMPPDARLFLSQFNLDFGTR